MYDKVILGAGMYGLYAASELSKLGFKTLVIEIDADAFERGSYINQARVHNGYHYPRSYATASKSAKYFERFVNDFGDCINQDFRKIYALASDYSWTNREQFIKFCNGLGVRCDEISKMKYFNKQSIKAAFDTLEYTFDAQLIKEKLLRQVKENDCDILFNTKIHSITKEDNYFIISLDDKEIKTEFILNATYASTNQIHEMMGYKKLNIKYELCEIILCNVSKNIQHVGLTVMDGPFFSIMPFGKTGYHSLTAVSRTPHDTSNEELPTFDCQKNNSQCTPKCLANCNSCEYHPKSAFRAMKQIAAKYLSDDIEIEYVKSLYTIKPILKTSEIDDSRPTLVKQYSSKPDFYTVFSGKINTIYDLDELWSKENNDEK